jgi:hypothetical protein
MNIAASLSLTSGPGAVMAAAMASTSLIGSML